MADNAGDHGRWRKDYPKIAPEVPGAPSTVDEAAQYVLELIARMDQTS